MDQLVEFLLCNCETLNSNTGPTKNNNNNKKKTQQLQGPMPVIPALGRLRQENS
jgi:hypothetical protein